MTSQKAPCVVCGVRHRKESARKRCEKKNNRASLRANRAAFDTNDKSDDRLFRWGEFEIDSSSTFLHTPHHVDYPDFYAGAANSSTISLQEDGRGRIRGHTMMLQAENKGEIKTQGDNYAYVFNSEVTNGASLNIEDIDVRNLEFKGDATNSTIKNLKEGKNFSTPYNYSVLTFTGESTNRQGGLNVENVTSYARDGVILVKGNCNINNIELHGRNAQLVTEGGSKCNDVRIKDSTVNITDGSSVHKSAIDCTHSRLYTTEFYDKQFQSDTSFQFNVTGNSSINNVTIISPHPRAKVTLDNVVINPSETEKSDGFTEIVFSNLDDIFVKNFNSNKGDRIGKLMYDIEKMKELDGCNCLDYSKDDPYSTISLAGQ